MEKQKNNFFSNNKRMIKVSLVLYIVIAFVITGTSVAWFVTNKKVEVAPTDDISITVDSRVEISVDGEVWGSSLQVDPNITQYADVSGNGIDFWFPRYLSDSDQVDLGNRDAFEHVNTRDPEKSDPYFITIRLKVRSATAMDLYLDGTIGEDGKSSSYVSPKEVNKVQGEGGISSYTRPSPLSADLSADYIAAAARVAFVEVVDGVEELRALWIPNDKTQLYYDSNGIPRVNTAGDREAYGCLQLNDDEMENYIYSVEDMLGGSIIVGDPQSQDAKEIADGMIPPVVGMNNPIISFDGTKLEEKELIIRIWIEGTDREANAALNGGDMIYKFAFTSIVKSLPEEQELTFTEQGLFYGDSEAGDLVYSVNGIDWSTYSNKSLGNAIPDDVNNFYVRKKETVACKAGAIYCVDRELKTVTLFSGN